MDDIDVGEDMTAAEIAKHFGEPAPADKASALSSAEEIQKFEKDAENSTDIYRTVGRIKNLARGNGSSLTPHGEALCNMHAHLIFSFYELAKTFPEPYRTQLIELARKNESTPASIIEATKAGVIK